uniref:YDG domain-containing protein n=1 Tax=Ellagibacter sp. TaxID=2137578 RepID=UPI003AB71AD5
MKKKTLIMLLTSILCIALLPAVAHAATPDVWDGSTASSLTGGGKSEDDPYLISTGAELKLLADNSRATGLGSCYVKLTNDIVLNDGTFDKSGAFTKRGATTTSQPNEWLPMGEASWHIDGDGHSISGMYIKCNEAKVGLIGRIAGSGYIRDLTIKDSYVASSQAPQSYKGYIGVFVGQSSRTSFTNCVGENNIAVTDNCYLTGGIVGWSYGGDSFNVVHVSGSIQGSGKLAGIAGRANRATFKNCWNEMGIDNASSYQSITQSGGIVALADSSEFYNCANLGYLHGGSRIGGIAGEAPGKMKNCYTTSDISGIKEYGSRNYVATLAGMNSQNVAVQGCYAEDGSGLYDIGAEGEGSYVPHFTGKGNLGGGSDGELLAALNENLYSMDAEPNLNKWVLNSDGYPIPTGETFVDDTVYYDIWLDGVRVSERNEADILGDGLATYDKATNTLFLHDGIVVTAAYNQKLLYSEGDINLCVDGDVKFQSSQNVGTGPCIIDLGSAGGSGNLKIYAPEGTSATVTVTGKYAEYGIDVSSLTLEGDVSLKVSADSAFAFCNTMTFTSPQAMLDAVSRGDRSAMLNPVQTINLPSSNAQKLYEDQGMGLVQVDAFTTSRKVDGYPYPVDRMYPHIRIAPVVSELVDSLPDSFTVSMTDANEESSLAAWVLGEIRKIEGITEDNSSVVVSDVQAATAGTFASQDGEAGSFTATVTLQMGGASMTKVIPGTIEPAAYAPPVITTGIKAGTVDAETGLFVEATDATFTCGDGVVFAVSYEADGVPVKDLQGSVSCYADKGLAWSEANGCYLTPTEPADCFTFEKAARYEVIFRFLATEEYGAQVGSIDIDVVRRTLAPSDFTFAAPSDLAYDGSAKVASFEFSGKLSCDGAQTVSYLSDGVAVSEAVDPGTYAVQLDVQECDSYNAATLTDPSWTFTIGPKQLSDLDFSDITVVKVYDGTTDAGILEGTVGFTGKCGDDDVSIVATPGPYAEGDVDAGTGKTVTLELSLAGADASKYTLASSSATFDHAKIIKAQLSASSFVDPAIQVIWRGEGYGPISGTLTANDFFAEGEVPDGAKIVAAGKATSETVLDSVSVADDGTLSYSKAASSESAFKTSGYDVAIEAKNYRGSAPLTVRQLARAGFDEASYVSTWVYGEVVDFMKTLDNPGANFSWTWTSSDPDVLAVVGQFDSGGNSTVAFKANGEGHARIDVTYLSDTVGGTTEPATSDDANAAISGNVVKRSLEPQPSSARITIGDALPDIAVTYLDFVRDGKVYSAFADGDSADEVLENAYDYQLIDADGNVVSAEEACNKAGAYRIVPIAKIRVDENNWGSKYELIGGAEGALEVFYPPAPHFTDVDYNSWYAPGVEFVASRGLMTGYEGTTVFGVGNALTRGELATIL